MNGETEKIAGIPVEKLREAIDKKDATRIANSTPLPGPLKDAFAIAPDISVDKWLVRPFYDGDYDILVSLGNPLGEMMTSTIAGKDSSANYFPRGQTAYEICYLFTTDIEQCAEEVEEGTFKKKAKLAFFKQRLAGLIEIHNAVMKQLSIYWSTTIGYEAAEQGDEGTVKKKLQENPLP